jgi:hypothetical protein
LYIFIGHQCLQNKKWISGVIKGRVSSGPAFFLSSTNPLPKNQDILPHRSGFALGLSRPSLQTRKQGLISLKIGEISGKKFENVAKPRRKERIALIIPPESFELLATWRSMRKRRKRA